MVSVLVSTSHVQVPLGARIMIGVWKLEGTHLMESLRQLDQYFIRMESRRRYLDGLEEREGIAHGGVNIGV